MKHNDIALLVSLALILMLLICLGATMAWAADDKTCAIYGRKVEALVLELTNDEDTAQAAGWSAVIHCGVIDYPIDVIIKTDGDPLAEEVAKVDKPKTKPVDPAMVAWRAACAKRYKSLDTSDMTVIPAGRKKRVTCPIPKEG